MWRGTVLCHIWQHRRYVGSQLVLEIEGGRFSHRHASLFFHRIAADPAADLGVIEPVGRDGKSRSGVMTRVPEIDRVGAALDRLLAPGCVIKLHGHRSVLLGDLPDRAEMIPLVKTVPRSAWRPLPKEAFHHAARGVALFAPLQPAPDETPLSHCRSILDLRDSHVAAQAVRSRPLAPYWKL
jgi:hypothetical protein